MKLQELYELKTGEKALYRIKDKSYVEWLENRDSHAKEYAKNLANNIWKKFYSKEILDWELFDDLLAVLTQIDNMICGLSKNSAEFCQCSSRKELKTTANPKCLICGKPISG